MDWKYIKEKYSKAWNKLCEFHKDTNEGVAWIDHPDVWIHEGMEINAWELRHLYDFFDNEGLNIYLNLYGNYFKIILAPSFDWTKEGFWDTSKYHKDFKFVYDNRREAETAAFTKAFEILNDKLK